MASKIPEDMLRELNLTPDETQMIVDEAERVISETLAVNELFLNNNRVLPKSEWKLVKGREKVQVYRRRKEKKKCCSASNKSSSVSIGKTSPFDLSRPRSNTSEATFVSTGASGSVPLRKASATSSRSDSSGSSDGFGNSSGSSSNACSESSVLSTTDMPLVIATGIIAGTIDDVAFGNLAHTERLTRSRDIHKQEEFAGVKILATILKPTAQDPFQSLVVKWSAKKVGGLMRMRDCVFIEANGIATTANGERIAYNLVHSIDSIARIPGFKHLDIVRVNTSTCSISRQYDQSSIEVFSRGFADPGGNFAEAISNSVYTEILLSVVHVVDCAYMKKLIWLAQVKRESSRKVSHSGSLRKPAKHCGNCAASLTTFGIHTGTACQACQQEICGKCSVNKKLAIEVSSSEMTTKTVTFCLHCVIEAKQIPTWQAAVSIMAMRGQIA